MYWSAGYLGALLASLPVLVVWSARGLRTQTVSGNTALIMLYGLASMGLVFVSTSPERSMPAGWWTAALCVAAAPLASNTADTSRRAILRGLAIASLAVAAPNLIEWLRAGAPLLWRVTYEHNNGVALFNVLFLAALATGELKRPGWWGWLLVFAWLHWYSGSRGGVLGLVAGGLVLVYTARAGRSAWPMWAGLLVAPLGLVGAALDGRLLALSSRQHYWRISVEMFLARPLWGQGQDTFQRFYLAQFSDAPFSHAHSLYLNTLAEGGLVGAALGLLLVGVVVYQLWQRRAGPWALGALAVTASVLAHGLVDVTMTSAFVATAVAVLVAVGLSEPNHDPDLPDPAPL